MKSPKTQPANKYQGEISTFNPQKNFGFIRSNDQMIFFHFRYFRAKRMPQIGEKVLFEIGYDKKKRIMAVNIQEAGFIKRQQKQQQIHLAYQEQKHKFLNAICGFCVVYFLFISALIISSNLSNQLIFWYIIISIISFISYYHDKQIAQNDYIGKRRIPENTLHLLDVLGGWIGAAFAQKMFNHKTNKPSFRKIYYLTIIFNIAAMIAMIYYLNNLI